MNITSIACGCALAITGMLCTGQAAAVTSNRTQAQNGAGACQSALPVFDGNIRKRPLGIGNEGTFSAYVSCSLAAEDLYVSLNSSNGLLLSNRGTATATVDCTLVTGILNVNIPSYFPKSVAIPAGGWTSLFWSPGSDNGGAAFENGLNYSCRLPVGVDINTIFTNIEEEVGA